MTNIATNRNVYQMWFEPANPSGTLWLTRTTWSSVLAEVKSVGKPTGPPPYYGNPKVLVDIFNLDGTIRERGAVLSAAGTYKTYRQIPAPPWGGDSTSKGFLA